MMETILEKIEKYLDRKERFYLTINQAVSKPPEGQSFAGHKLDFIFELKEKIKEWKSFIST